MVYTHTVKFVPVVVESNTGYQFPFNVQHDGERIEIDFTVGDVDDVWFQVVDVSRGEVEAHGQIPRGGAIFTVSNLTGGDKRIEVYNDASQNIALLVNITRAERIAERMRRLARGIRKG